MGLVVVYREEATDDIAEAIRWYHDQLAGLDERFLKAVLSCEARIHQFPKGAPVVHKHMRQVPLRAFRM